MYFPSTQVYRQEIASHEASVDWVLFLPCTKLNFAFKNITTIFNLESFLKEILNSICKQPEICFRNQIPAAMMPQQMHEHCQTKPLQIV